MDILPSGFARFHCVGCGADRPEHRPPAVARARRMLDVKLYEVNHGRTSSPDLQCGNRGAVGARPGTTGLSGSCQPGDGISAGVPAVARRFWFPTPG